MPTFEVVCEHCRSRYVVPLELRDALRGRTVPCAWCLREWTPLPVDPRDPVARSRAASFEAPFPLHPYLQSESFGAPAPATDGPLVRSTTQLVRVAPATPQPSLRVAASGPEFELKAVYSLGSASFLVGRKGCHLELPKALALPERAIRVTAAGGGFQLCAIDRFLIPVGAKWETSVRLEADGQLDLVLSPYRVSLRPSATPGLPIPDLESPPSAAASATRAPDAGSTADLSQTVRDFAALGLETRRQSDPLASLDVGFVHLDPPTAGDTIWIRKSPVIVGRTSGDVLLADRRVSGKHAQIDVLGIDQYALKDLASTNGTTVNDRPASSVRLKDGDVVSFGGVRLQFVARAKRR
jgi:hypothetical protein